MLNRELCSEVVPDMPHNGEILALDIGTRTIMGVVLEKSAGGGYRLRAAQQYEHLDRAMYQGQVHNVAAVAQGVYKVKTALERRRKTTFHRAAVAAAGRTLKMSTGQARHQRSSLSAVTAAEIKALELEALRVAQAQLAREEGEAAAAGFFCVGYSISQYLLDGQPISELLGQVSPDIGVELIATFLPRVVVNGLFAVLQRAGLEPASLTLEPIAALEVSVPRGMRQLNLALLDIGAGTADIALVRHGRVFAYDMAPLAGDKITDSLCQRYLLDFATGEAVKKQLTSQDEVTFTDILGAKHQVPSAHIVASLEPVIKQVAEKIAAQILSLNGRSPDAILLVGGGSLTPGLPQALAAALELPESRAGIRTREMIGTVIGQPKKLSGPQGVTPLGIAVTAFGDGPLHFVDVTVNNQPVPLWQGAGQTVADALLAAGGNWTHLFGRPGLALTAEVNGRLQVIPGEQGQPPLILVNGQTATLDTALGPGDRVEFTPGASGRPAQATVRDLVTESRFLTINGNTRPFPAAVRINGKPVGLDSPVSDRAQITISWERPVKEILVAAGVDPAQVKEQDLPYQVGGHHYILSYSPCQVRLNNRASSMAELVRPGDRLDYDLDCSYPTVGLAVAKHIAPNPPLTVSVNGQELELPDSGTQILVNGQPAQLENPLLPQAEITVLTGRSKFIVSDLFTLIDVKRQAAPGASLQMTVNGKSATFTTPLHHGDRVSLAWNRQQEGGEIDDNE